MMPTMKQAKNWLKWLGGLVLFVLVAVGARALFMRRGRPVLPDVKHELAAIAAERQTAKLEAKQGHAVALAAVYRDHAVELAKLDDAAAAQAESLSADPQALAGFLVRAARG